MQQNLLLLEMLMKFIDKTDNIFRAVSIMAKRSTQVNENMKKNF